MVEQNKLTLNYPNDWGEDSTETQCFGAEAIIKAASLQQRLVDQKL
jgi:hypothetical protein